jgi:hypothetical protein
MIICHFAPLSCIRVQAALSLPQILQMILQNARQSQILAALYEI